jgi:hypothetical protein
MFLGRLFEYILRRTTTIFEKGPRKKRKAESQKSCSTPGITIGLPFRDRLRTDFAIYASYQINAGGMFVGLLKVVRKTDSRLLFPFEGA